MNLPTIMESANPAELTNLSTQTLRSELARSLTVSAQTLTRLAMIWKELEVRGEDLSDLRAGLASYLPLIAAGQLDAEVVVRFAGNKTLLGTISRLPLEEQHRLATGGKVDILSIADDGSEIISSVPAHALSATQARQIFAEGWIRKPEDQRAALAAYRNNNKTSQSGKQSKISVDRKTGTIKIGRNRMHPGEIFAAMAELYPESDPSEERDKALPVRLTESEHRRIRVASAESGKTADLLMRLALHNAGLI